MNVYYYIYINNVQASDDMVVELHSTRLDLNSTRLALEEAALKFHQAEVFYIYINTMDYIFLCVCPCVPCPLGGDF